MSAESGRGEEHEHDHDHDTAEHVALGEWVARFYEAEPTVRARVEVAGSSHPGKVRPNNEDQFLAVRRYRGRSVLATSLPVEILDRGEDDAYVLAVADGMGGRHFGELASLLALLTGWALGGDEVKWPVKVNDREDDELREKAGVFFERLNRAILDEIGRNPRLAGMGTTLTVAYTAGPELFVMHAGDSRAYLHRGGALIRLTRDHNLAQLLVDSGVAEPGSPEARRVRHVLTNVLGGPDAPVEVDVRRHTLADGDALLLCTDGLTDGLADDEIARALDDHPAPADACRALIDRALDRGGQDNVTVLIARYRFEPRPDGPA
jgi:serine/threonine protein phosphatase PrpC